MSHRNKIRNSENLYKNGHWGKFRWWAEKSYQEAIGLSFKEIDEAIVVLSKVFDSEWFRECIENPIRHPLIHIFTCQGIYPLKIMLRVSSWVQAINKAKAGSEAIIKRLKHPEQYDGAITEACVVKLLCDHSMEFQFEEKQALGKVHDITVLGPGVPFNIEVKHLLWPQQNQAYQRLANFVCFELSDLMKGYDYECRFDGEFIKASKSLGQYETIALNEKMKEIKTEIEKYVVGNDPQFEIDIPHIGGIKCWKSSGNTSRGIGGPSIDQTVQTSRMVSKIFDGAISQFPSNMPAVIAFEIPPFLIDIQLAKDLILSVLKDEASKLSHITGVIVISHLFSDGELQSGIGAIQNPKANFTFEQLSMDKNWFI